MKRYFIQLLRDLVWAIPIGMLLLAEYGPVVMIVFVVGGGTIRALTTDMDENED